MAKNLFFWCAAIFLVGPIAGYHCQENCDSEGLIPEELPTTFIPVEQVSQCAEPPGDVLSEAVHCDDSSTGTGHLLYEGLTEDVLAVERCYSFCFISVCTMIIARTGHSSIHVIGLHKCIVFACSHDPTHTLQLIPSGGVRPDSEDLNDSGENCFQLEHVSIMSYAYTVLTY